MTGKPRDRGWTLEPPDRRPMPFESKRALVAYVRANICWGARPLIRKLAKGCYRFDPPVTRAPAVILGPWLLYDAHGAKYLESLEQRALAFERADEHKADRAARDGV